MGTKEATSSIAISNRLGELLVSEGMLSYDQLHECLELQKRDGRILSAIISEKGYMSAEKLVEFISAKCGFKFVRLSERGAVKPDVLKLVPEKFARQRLLLPRWPRRGRSGAAATAGTDGPPRRSAAIARSPAGRG